LKFRGPFCLFFFFFFMVLPPTKITPLATTLPLNDLLRTFYLKVNPIQGATRWKDLINVQK
jgi:hypothetical protein